MRRIEKRDFADRIERDLFRGKRAEKKKEDADWRARVYKIAFLLVATLVARCPRRHDLGNGDIHAGMRFPSGIAAGPIPAECTG